MSHVVLMLHLDSAAPSGGTRRVWLRVLEDGVEVAPDAVPLLSVGLVDESGATPVWNPFQDDLSMLSAATDTAVVDGALYYLDVEFLPERLHHVSVEATVGGVVVPVQATHRTDPPIPDHTHDGLDAPRVWWEDLRGKPEDVEGTTPDAELAIVEVEDQVRLEADGLREAPIREHGFGDPSTATPRANQVLKGHSGVERRTRFRARFEVAPAEGMFIQVRGWEGLLRVDRVVELEDGWFEVQTGPRFAVDDQRDRQRLNQAERYA